MLGVEIQTVTPEDAEYYGLPEVAGVLGHGGMGIVLKAEHALMDRVVALKLLSSDATNA